MSIVDTQSTGELDLSRVPSYPQSCCFKYTGQLRIHTAHVNYGYTAICGTRAVSVLSVSAILQMHRSAGDTHSSCQLWIHSQLWNSSCHSALSLSAIMQTHTSAGDTHN